MGNFFVYILSNDSNKMIYIGVTNDLKRRTLEHKLGTNDGYTKKYHIHKLVYYEQYSDVKMAIAREKQLKGWTRIKKSMLIEIKNPGYLDLSDKL